MSKKKMNIQKFVVINRRLFKTEEDAKAFIVQLDLSEELSQFIFSKGLSEQLQDMEHDGQCSDPKALIQNLETLIKILQKINPTDRNKLQVGELKLEITKKKLMLNKTDYNC